MRILWLLPLLLQGALQFAPPPIDFAIEPGNHCEPETPCYPHPPYGAWIGNAPCLPEVTDDFAHVPRPNRAPNTLFPGDTGCDIGAFQFTAGVVIPPTPATPRNLRLVF